MTCDQFEAAYAGALADGRDPHEDPKVAEHLSACSECRESTSGLADLWVELGRLPIPSAPESLRRIADTLAAAEKDVRRASVSTWRPALAAGIAGVLLGGTLVGLLGDYRADGPRIAELESDVEQLRALTETALAGLSSSGPRLALIASARHTEDTITVHRLLGLMRSEERVSTKLAALVGLEAHADDPFVIEQLSEILMDEGSAHVQIAILRLIGADTATGATLVEFLERRDLDETVRDEARAILTAIGSEART